MNIFKNFVIFLIIYLRSNSLVRGAGLEPTITIYGKAISLVNPPCL